MPQRASYLFPRIALALLLAVCAAAVRSEDIDLFMSNPASSNSLSNILIVLDNSANWSSKLSSGTTKFAAEQAALRTAVTNLTVDSAGRATVRLGILMFSESGSANPAPPGGVVRFAVRDMDSAGKTAMLSFINGLNENNDKGNGANYALAMHEAYLYLKGLTAYAGGNKAKADNNAFSTKPTYKAPSLGSTCGKNIVIFMSNGAPDNGENTTAQSLLTALGGKLGTDPLKLNPSGKQANWSDEYARFMDGKKIYTYTIDVAPLLTGAGPDNTALLKSMAARGEGAYFAATDSGTLLNAINSILNSVTALNTVFAATALPVSVNVRGTYLNEIYMAVFRPDATARPRWFGNLKLYQLGISTSTGGADSIFFADALGKEALDSQTGFLKFDAPSFWTSASASPYWDYAPRGTPPSASDYPDGEVVEKGGAAQVQRTKWPTTTRTLYTCSAGCSAGATLSELFNTSNTAINPSAGTTIFNNSSVSPVITLTKPDIPDLINWVRGQDIQLERTTGTTSGVRPSLHGDVVHSRPAVVSYNRSGKDDDIVVFYGAADGVLRAVQGGKVKSTLSGAPDPGTELWGFVAPEFYTGLARLWKNSPNINVPSVSSTTATASKPVANNKPYFFDGNFTVYAYDKPGAGGLGDGKLVAADGDKVYLFATARRGGRLLYAFDVSNPGAPTFLWRKNGADTSAGNADFRELGFTWSEAKVVKLKLSSGDKTALIFGAGYDPVEDDNPAGTATMGRGIYVVDADTGALIWRVGPAAAAGNAPTKQISTMTKTFPADVTVLDRNGDGYADRVYAVDTGANVWRLDIGATSVASWNVTRLATLGTSSATASASDVNARKFLTPPDVVYGNETDGTRYDAILVGTGDREKPFDSVVQNRFYMLKDYDVSTDSTRTTPLTEGSETSTTANTLYDATNNLIQQGADKTGNINLLRQAGGWYVRLGSGEKVSGGASTLAGSVFFGTNSPAPPDPTTCVTNLGTANSYGFSYKDATATFEFDNVAGFTKADRSKSMVNGGLLPSPTPIVVNLNGERRLAVCFGPTCLSFKQSYGRRGRVFWSKTID